MEDAQVRDIAGVIARAWGRLPEGHSEDPLLFAACVIGYLNGHSVGDVMLHQLNLMGTDPDQTKRLYQIVKDLYHYNDFVIASMAGAIQALQFETDLDLAERMEQGMQAAVEVTDPEVVKAGGFTPWMCLFCNRHWDENEPDKCPDCDAWLVRTRIVGDEEAEKIKEALGGFPSSTDSSLT